MDQSILDNNQRQLSRLMSLAASITDRELATPMAAGWTVAAVLAHLAFWDRRALLLIERWKEGGFNRSPLDDDLVNEVTRYFFLCLPPREALRLAVESAKAIDQTLAGLDPDFAAAMLEKGKNVQVNRGSHRGAHLDEIEQAIRSQAA